MSRVGNCPKVIKSGVDSQPVPCEIQREPRKSEPNPLIISTIPCALKIKFKFIQSPMFANKYNKILIKLIFFRDNIFKNFILHLNCTGLLNLKFKKDIDLFRFSY